LHNHRNELLDIGIDVNRREFFTVSSFFTRRLQLYINN